MTLSDEMLKLNAEVAFNELKQVLLALEGRGFRPQLLTHGNGMPHELRIDPAHATTRQVDAIREQNRAARLAA